MKVQDYFVQGRAAAGCVCMRKAIRNNLAAGAAGHSRQVERVRDLCRLARTPGGYCPRMRQREQREVNAMPSGRWASESTLPGGEFGMFSRVKYDAKRR